jgi:hypothetical protein
LTTIVGATGQAVLLGQSRLTSFDLTAYMGRLGAAARAAAPTAAEGCEQIAAMPDPNG